MLPDRDTTVARILDHLRGRMDTQFPKPRANEADGDAVAFMCGAAAAIDALGLDQTHGVTGLAFLASVRGADEILKDKGS